MAKKKRKGGNPRKQSASGRVTGKPCSRRAGACAFGSHRTVNGGPRVTFCSWCGARKDGRRWESSVPVAPEGVEVPDEWFSSEGPVIALGLSEWQAAHRDLDVWPVEARAALLAALSDPIGE